MRKILFISTIFVMLFYVVVAFAGGKNKAPKLELKDLEGNVVTHNDLMGKPTVLVFWSLNCHSCKDEIPKIDKLYRKYKDKVNFYAVVVNTDNKKEIKETKQRWGFKMPVLIGDMKTMYRFRIFGTPITYVITPDWKVYKKYIGKAPTRKIEKNIKDLLEKN
jgi:thiol-disulfide isomerase/thioredoxin